MLFDVLVDIYANESKALNSVQESNLNETICTLIVNNALCIQRKKVQLTKPLEKNITFDDYHIDPLYSSLKAIFVS